MAESRVITLKGAPYIDEDGVAVEEVIPGSLVEIPALGQIQNHSGAGDPAARAFALERDEMGADIDEPYAIGDVVKVGNFSPGMRVNVRIESGLVNVGEFLESAGDGQLTAYSSGVIVARALETGGLNGPQRLRAEVY